jgi:hypothetical protein
MFDTMLMYSALCLTFPWLPGGDCCLYPIRNMESDEIAMRVSDIEAMHLL